MKIEAGKYYRTADGRKVGPMSYESYGDGYDWYGEYDDNGAGYWSDDGERQLPQFRSTTNLVSEWGHHLHELNLNIGDVVECVEVGYGSYVYAAGQVETVVHDDGGLEWYGIDVDEKRCKGLFRVVSRAADTPEPTLWRDMTPEQKGALLLAKFEGDRVERWINGKWVSYQGCIYDIRAYRIAPPKPKHVVSTEIMHVKVISIGKWVTMHGGHDTATHRITFDTIDGVPQLDTIKMAPTP